MLKNYLRVAFRNPLKHKVHSSINIVGLSLGIALSILVFMFVRNELSFDAFHKNGDDIYRVCKASGQPGASVGSVTSLPLRDDLKRSLPEISEATRLASSTVVIEKDQNAISEVLTFVDPEFFDIFSFPITAGNRELPLNDLSSLVLSEAHARKYFGQDDAVGRTLKIKLADSSYVLGSARLLTTERNDRASPSIWWHLLRG